MSNFFIGTEVKLFCLLILGVLWFFLLKNPYVPSLKQKNLYLFAFVGIVLSVLAGVASLLLKDDYIFDLCNLVYGLCFAVSVYSGCEYIFKTENKNGITLKKILFLTISLFYGILSFVFAGYKINIMTYMLILAIIFIFSVEQYNKMRIDNLTKLYNRYGMDAEIREQLKQYKRENTDSFYIIACDLDNFKHINDTWGHLEGDRALVLIADVLSKVSKMYNSEVFRIGGDEFVIITDTSEEGLANEVTNSLKNELNNIDFRDDFDIKMSIGFALYDGVTPIDDLLNNADKKLYEAKKNSKK